MTGPAVDPPFDDFLGLLGRDLSGVRFLILEGVSGSGKSTTLRHLLKAHQAYQGADVYVVEGMPLVADPAGPRPDQLVLFDEIRGWRDLGWALSLARRARGMLIASHLPRLAHAPFHWMGRTLFLKTDTGTAKLATELSRRGITASPRALDAYFARYGGSYTEMEIILEAYPGDDFDRSLGRFLATHTVTREPMVTG